MYSDIDNMDTCVRRSPLLGIEVWPRDEAQIPGGELHVDDRRALRRERREQVRPAAHTASAPRNPQTRSGSG